MFTFCYALDGPCDEGYNDCTQCPYWSEDMKEQWLKDAEEVYQMMQEGEKRREQRKQNASAKL